MPRTASPHRKPAGVRRRRPQPACTSSRSILRLGPLNPTDIDRPDPTLRHAGRDRSANQAVRASMRPVSCAALDRRARRQLPSRYCRRDRLDQDRTGVAIAAANLREYRSPRAWACRGRGQSGRNRPAKGRISRVMIPLPFGPTGPRPVIGFPICRVIAQRTRIGLLDSVGFCVSRNDPGSDDGESVAGNHLDLRRAGRQRALGQPVCVAGLSDMRRPRRPLAAVAGRARRLSKRRGGPRAFPG